MAKNEESMRVKMVMVTPEMASAWLEKHNTNNRHLQNTYAERLAEDMRNNRWHLTHEAIAFDTDGVLLDGQHRLWAVVLSGKTVPLHVWRGADPETFKVVDTGKSRSARDIINISGDTQINNSHISTVRAMFNGMSRIFRPSPQEMMDCMKTHRDAALFAVECLPSKFKGVACAPTRAVLARAYYTQDREQLRTFAAGLTGQVPITMEAGFLTVSALQKYLLTTMGGSSAIGSEKYAKTESALVNFLHGRNVQNLRAIEYEAFPLPSEKPAKKAAVRRVRASSLAFGSPAK